MSWYQILTLAISLLTLFGFGAIMKHFWDDRHTKKLADSEQQKQLKKEQRQAEIREVVQQELAPLKTTMNEVLQQAAKSEKGTVTLLRDQMKMLLDICATRGWAGHSDKANYAELYATYSDLGGNHFKEYVDEWKKEMDGLPGKPGEEKLPKQTPEEK